MTDQKPVTIDPADIVTVLNETHPEAVRMAVWRVRAEKAEARERELQARVRDLEAGLDQEAS